VEDLLNLIEAQNLNVFISVLNALNETSANWRYWKDKLRNHDFQKVECFLSHWCSCVSNILKGSKINRGNEVLLDCSLQNCRTDHLINMRFSKYDFELLVSCNLRQRRECTNLYIEIFVSYQGNEDIGVWNKQSLIIIIISRELERSGKGGNLPSISFLQCVDYLLLNFRTMCSKQLSK